MHTCHEFRHIHMGTRIKMLKLPFRGAPLSPNAAAKSAAARALFDAAWERAAAALAAAAVAVQYCMVSMTLL